MAWKITAVIWILVPGLLARIVNFDPNIFDTDLESKILQKQVPERCDTDESVQLSGMQLTDIPKHAIKSRTIRSIILENNLITKVPEDIFKDVPNLQCLNLARNNIPFARLLNFKHESLKVLIVNYQGENYESYDMVNDYDLNSNVVLQTSEAYFPNLESLHLNNVNFEFFHPSFNQSFPRLRTLYMADNLLTHMKRNLLSRLPSYLKSLHLERNRFETVYLEDMGNLEQLYLDENPVVNLEVYDPINNLRMLSLSNCSLENNVGNILNSARFPSLTALDLSRNRIHVLYENSFQHITSLEALSLSHNELTTLPHLRYLIKLGSLSLSDNFIEDVASTTLPSSLKLLNLRGNRIRSIDKTTFSELRLLEELDLSMNKLRSLPPGWGKDMNVLRYLNLNSNQFASIADMMVSSAWTLNELHIKGNIVKTIDENSLQLIPSQCTVYVICKCGEETVL